MYRQCRMRFDAPPQQVLSVLTTEISNGPLDTFRLFAAEDIVKLGNGKFFYEGADSSVNPGALIVFISTYRELGTSVSGGLAFSRLAKGGGTHVMNVAVVVRPKIHRIPYNAGMEHVGLSSTRQTTLAPSAKRGEVLSELHEG